jgi:putative DNA primase/helicase
MDDGNKPEQAGGSDPGSMTLEQMRAAVEARAQAEAAELAASCTAGGNVNGRHTLGYRFLKQCLDANELGDGVLFSTLQADKYIFNASGQQWMRWTGQHWEADVEERALGSVEPVASEYLRMLPMLGDKLKLHAADKEKVAKFKKIQTKVIRRASRLRSDRGRKNCLKLSATAPDSSMVCRGDVFDGNRMLLACANAVIDLELGEAVKANPADMVLKAAPAEWRGIDHPAPIWDRTISEIFESREDLIGFLHRLLGYSITGLTTEHVLPILQGIGRNGKSLIFDTLASVLGEIVSPVPVEMLLDQGRSRSAAAPSPDIMALKGVRIAVAAEADENRRFSMGRVKWLTGNDQLTGRWPNDKYPCTFMPTHKLFLLTNDLPHASANDYAFWERVCVIPFRLSFVNRDPAREFERRADLALFDKLKEEASGILAWLVRGCLEWRRIGLDPPPVVKESTLRYRADEDYLQDWIDERCVLDPYAQTPAGRLYENFADWYVLRINKNRKKTPSQRAFGQMLSKRFRREKHGTYIYYGLECDEIIDEPDNGQRAFD